MYPRAYTLLCNGATGICLRLEMLSRHLHGRNAGHHHLAADRLKVGGHCHLNPVHLGLTVCLTIALGLLTPPYGLCTLISCAIGKTKLTDVLKPMIPMFCAMLAVVVFIAYFRKVALFLPRLLVPNLVSAR